VLAVVASLTDPGHAARLHLVAGCDLTIAAGAFLSPWERWKPLAPAWLGLPGFAVLGLSTWSFGGVAAGTGPFLILLYAWAALHCPRWVLGAYAAPATVAYLLPLVLTDQPDLVLGSAFILMPVALAVAFLIEAQGRHLRDDRERLARIEQWRAAMMNTLAHDVRNPLGTVQMVLGELRDDAAGPEAEMLEVALRQTARLSRLADGLLDVQRIDSSGHLKLDRQVYSAGVLVQEALSYLRPGEEIQTEILPGAEIYVDKQRFEQILLNLVTNGLRYGEPPIVIRIERRGAVDRLEVRDHGPGIPESLRDTLFGQFAVGSTTGVGLGLWIVRQLAVAHGGQAVAEPRDPGVAMVVTLPIPP
jgi:signal transduction histidine kinase